MSEVVKPYTEKRRATNEIGSTGLRRAGGSIDEEQLRVLRGSRGAEVYEEMRNNDSGIGAFIFLTVSLIRSVPWRAEPNPKATNADAADKEAEFLTECIGDMSHTWSDFMAEVLSMVWHGWSYFNRVYKYRRGPGKDPRFRSKFDDGRIAWRKFAIRGQESLVDWVFDDDGGIRGMRQLAAPQYEIVEIPIEESVLFRTELAKNNPEGRSLLRNSYRPYFFTKRLQEIEAIGMERELVGLPKIELPMSYLEALASDRTDSDTQRRREAALAFATIGSQIRRNEHDVLLFPSEVNDDGSPSQFKFSLVSAGGSRSIDIAGAIKRSQFDVVAPLQNQFIYLATNGAGSYALSSDQTNNHAVAIGALLDSIEETFHRYATEELFELNGVLPENRPRWVHGDIEKEDLAKWVESVSKAISAGLVTPDESLEAHARNKLELPEADERDDDDVAPPMNFGLVPSEDVEDENGEEIEEPEDVQDDGEDDEGEA